MRAYAFAAMMPPPQPFAASNRRTPSVASPRHPPNARRLHTRKAKGDARGGRQGKQPACQMGKQRGSKVPLRVWRKKGRGKGTTGSRRATQGHRGRRGRGREASLSCVGRSPRSGGFDPIDPLASCFFCNARAGQVLFWFSFWFCVGLRTGMISFGVSERVLGKMDGFDLPTSQTNQPINKVQRSTRKKEGKKGSTSRSRHGAVALLHGVECVRRRVGKKVGKRVDTMWGVCGGGVGVDGHVKALKPKQARGARVCAAAALIACDVDLPAIIRKKRRPRGTELELSKPVGLWCPRGGLVCWVAPHWRPTKCSLGLAAFTRVRALVPLASKGRRGHSFLTSRSRV